MQTNEEDKMRLNRFSTLDSLRYGTYSICRCVYVFICLFLTLEKTLQQPEANGIERSRKKRHTNERWRKKKCATLQNVWKTVENAQEKKHHSNYMEFGEGEKNPTRTIATTTTQAAAAPPPTTTATARKNAVFFSLLAFYYFFHIIHFLI